MLADVSRETAHALERYVDSLLRWNARINLIGRGTVGDVWDRHIVDSAQLCRHAGAPDRWVDFGSGGGLPALVVAILAKEGGRPASVTCIESDRRKCAFLSSISRDLHLPVSIVAGRIEAADPVQADVVSARALAPLSRLLAYAERHLAPSGICLFPKGKSWRMELETARRAWHFSCEVLPSATDRDAVVLKIGDLSRA